MESNKWTIETINEGSVSPSEDNVYGVGFDYKDALLYKEGIISGSISTMSTAGWSPVKDFYSNKSFILDALNNYERLKADNEKLLEALANIIDLFPDNPKLPISYQVLGIANEAMAENNPKIKADIETVKNYHPENK